MKRQQDSTVDASVDTSLDESVNAWLREIGSRIKHARQHLRMTQEELAELAGAKSKSGLQDNERGRSMPGGYIISALAKRGINTNWIFTGEGEVTLGNNPYQDQPNNPALVANEPTPSVVDMVLLQQVIDFFYRWQADNGVRVDQEKIGTVIAILYRIAASSGNVRKSELEQVLALAA